MGNSRLTNVSPQFAGPQLAGTSNFGPQIAGPQIAVTTNSGPQTAGPLRRLRATNFGPQIAAPTKVEVFLWLLP